VPRFRVPVDIPADVKEKIDFGKTNLVSHMFGRWGAVPVSLFAGKDSAELV
jgi:hypothetical protein